MLTVVLLRLLINAGAHRSDDQRLNCIMFGERDHLKIVKHVFFCNPTSMHCLVNKGQTSVKSNNMKKIKIKRKENRLVRHQCVKFPHVPARGLSFALTKTLIFKGI
jgi:hypothetical protein